VRITPPCYQPAYPLVMKYSGFRPDFTMHDWCRKFYVGDEAENGDIIPCDCPCHGKNAQGEMFSLRCR
jgi:hypothetical protein